MSRFFAPDFAFWSVPISKVLLSGVASVASPVYFRLSMKHIRMIIFSHLLVALSGISVEAAGPTIRLESPRQHVVTFEEVDEIARWGNKTAFFTLADQKWPLGGRTIVYPNLQILVFIDEEKGLGLRVPLVLSFDQYFRLRSSAQFKNLWHTSILSYVFDSQVRADRDGLLNLDLPVNLPTFLGGGTPVIRVLGNQKVEMDMASEWEEGSTSTATNRVSRVPNVSMKQTQEFTITGNIGEKIEVNIKQNSEAFTDLENNLSIRYEDVSDDGREGNGILKSFEAGNVSLELKNTEFTGYTQQHNGLFGVKMRSQLGQLSSYGYC